MNLSAIFSITMGIICAALSVLFLTKSRGVQSLQGEMQRQQVELQAQSLEAQNLQGQLQAQKQIIDKALQLSQETGPQILNDVGILARDNNNETLRAFLGKHGVQIKETPPPPEVATPAPETTAPQPQ